MNQEGPWAQPFVLDEQGDVALDDDGNPVVDMVRVNKYQFNGIERNEDLGLNWDLAEFRSYDAAIGRWTQVDPLAELAPNLTPFRFGLNNPILYVDPFGLFESRREARQERRRQRREARQNGESYAGARIRKNDEGRFDLRYKGSDGYVTRKANENLEYGVVASENTSSSNSFTEGFWSMMRAGDDWVINGGGEQFARRTAELTPGVAFLNATSGYSSGENIFGESIGTGDATLQMASALPPLKLASGLKLAGGLTALSGVIRVSKKAMGIKPVGSPKTLLSSAILFKLGLRIPLGRKVPTLIGPSASHLHTAIGRNAIPIGGAMFGAGYLLDKQEKE